MSGIGAIGGGGAAAAAASRVAPERTPVTRSDLRDAIGRAYEKVTGRAASKNVLDTLTAHACLETGSGAQMYNHNFGGIKGSSPEGSTAHCRTKEVFDGREVEVRDGFRAYRTLDGGATDYVRTMVGQFKGAVAKAETGDLDGFAHALKQAHYYTADETKYASALHAITGTKTVESTSHAHRTLGGLNQPPSDLVDTAGLSRVLNAISVHHPTVESDDADE